MNPITEPNSVYNHSITGEINTLEHIYIRKQ
jgi:hypothetical protein